METPDLVEPRIPQPPAPNDPSGMVLSPVGGAAPSQGMVATQDLIFAPPFAITPRNIPAIKRQIEFRCAEWGTEYMYSWGAKNRKAGTTSVIEGLSIRGAMDLHQMVGNAWVGILRVDETPTHWTFHAAYLDWETNSVTLRPFRQRISQALGMGSHQKAREEDIVYQIGASKATRNVILNALAPFAHLMLEEARKRVSPWVAANKEKAIAFIEKQVDALAIDLNIIERHRGRRFDKWTDKDIAVTMMELKAISEGQAEADSLYEMRELPEELKPAAPAPRAAAPKPAPQPAVESKLPFENKVSRTLVRYGFNSISQIKEMGRDEFIKAKGVGPAIIAAVDGYFTMNDIPWGSVEETPPAPAPAPAPAAPAPVIQQLSQPSDGIYDEQDFE